MLFDVDHTDGISCCVYENYDVICAKLPVQIRNSLYCCNHERELAKFQIWTLRAFFHEGGGPQEGEVTRLSI